MSCARTSALSASLPAARPRIRGIDLQQLAQRIALVRLEERHAALMSAVGTPERLLLRLAGALVLAVVNAGIGELEYGSVASVAQDSLQVADHECAAGVGEGPVGEGLGHV